MPYFPETSHHYLKYGWLSLCKMIFNFVKFYSCYSKIYRGSLFCGYSVVLSQLSNNHSPDGT